MQVLGDLLRQPTFCSALSALVAITAQAATAQHCSALQSAARYVLLLAPSLQLIPELSGRAHCPRLHRAACVGSRCVPRRRWAGRAAAALRGSRLPCPPRPQHGRAVPATLRPVPGTQCPGSGRDDSAIQRLPSFRLPQPQHGARSHMPAARALPALASEHYILIAWVPGRHDGRTVLPAAAAAGLFNSRFHSAIPTPPDSSSERLQLRGLIGSSCAPLSAHTAKPPQVHADRFGCGGGKTFGAPGACQVQCTWPRFGNHHLGGWQPAGGTAAAAWGGLRTGHLRPRSL